MFRSIWETRKVRGSLYTGRPGVPKRAVEPGLKHNSHDHSATCTKRSVFWTVICPDCHTMQSVVPGVAYQCVRC